MASSKHTPRPRRWPRERPLRKLSHVVIICSVWVVNFEAAIDAMKVEEKFKNSSFGGQGLDIASNFVILCRC